MSVAEFMESMQRKTRQNSLPSVISQSNNSIKNDTRSTSENQLINIVFCTEEKLVTTVKRRFETQVHILTISKNYNLFHIDLPIIFILIDFKCCFKNITKIIAKNPS